MKAAPYKLRYVFALVLVLIVWLGMTGVDISDQERMDAFLAGYDSGRFSMITSPLSPNERAQLRQLCSKEWPNDPTSVAAKARACKDI